MVGSPGGVSRRGWRTRRDAVRQIQGRAFSPEKCGSPACTGRGFRVDHRSSPKLFRRFDLHRATKAAGALAAARAAGLLVLRGVRAIDGLEPRAGTRDEVDDLRMPVVPRVHAGGEVGAQTLHGRIGDQQRVALLRDLRATHTASAATPEKSDFSKSGDSSGYNFLVLNLSPCFASDGPLYAFSSQG